MGSIDKVLEWLARHAGAIADLIREMGRFLESLLKARQLGPVAA